MLSGRVLTAQSLPTASTPALFRADYPRLVKSAFRRPFRFALSVAAVTMLQWRLCADGHTAISKVAAVQVFNGSRTMMTEGEGWCGIGDLKGWFIFIVNLVRPLLAYRSMPHGFAHRCPTVV